MRNRLLLLALALLLVCIFACDSANPVAPQGSTITLRANPARIDLDGVSAITVTGFRPDGNPLNPGTQINLTTTIGVLQPTVLSIGDNGQATASLTADGRTGTATITARTAIEDTMATVDVLIGEDDTSRPSLVISASPSVIGFNEISTISVLARRADGTNFGAGAQVRLTTTAGTFQPSGSTDITLTTNSNGEVTATLRAGSQVETAEVTAVLGSSEPAMTMVMIEDRKPVLEIFANPETIPVQGTSQITVLARDNVGNPLGAGQVIQLFASLGSIASQVTTDSNGRAQTTFQAGIDPGDGTAEIRAILGNSDTAEVVVQIRDAVTDLAFSANPLTIDRPVSDGTETIRLTAIARNSLGQGVVNVIVTFLSPDVGGVFQTTAGGASNGTVQTGGGGVAEVDLIVDEPGVGSRNSFRVQATVVSEGQTLTREIVITVR